jgi:hypothetical protein
LRKLESIVEKEIQLIARVGPGDPPDQLSRLARDAQEIFEGGFKKWAGGVTPVPISKEAAFFRVEGDTDPKGRGVFYLCKFDHDLLRDPNQLSEWLVLPPGGKELAGLYYFSTEGNPGRVGRKQMHEIDEDRTSEKMIILKVP